MRDTPLATVGVAGLGMDLMVLFLFCNFFRGLGVLKRPETIVACRHWFGCSLRPGTRKFTLEVAFICPFVVIGPID
jgi:hypothetical protein